MTSHPSHQMQLTSLYCYFPSYTEQEFNQKFRQKTKRDIITLLQKNRPLTDREIANTLGYKDPNKVRPRRNELVKNGLLEEAERRVCAVGLKQSIAWKLNPETLNAYMSGGDE